MKDNNISDSSGSDYPPNPSDSDEGHHASSSSNNSTPDQNRNTSSTSEGRSTPQPNDAEDRLQYAASQEAPTVVFQVPVIIITSDENNNRIQEMEVQAVQTEHPPPERQVANTSRPNVINQNPPLVIQDLVRIENRYYGYGTRFRTLSLPDLPNHRDAWITFTGSSARQLFDRIYDIPRETIESGRFGTHGRYRIERIGHANSSNQNPHFPGQVRRVEGSSRRGFDCFWLPDLRWVMSFRTPRYCRLYAHYAAGELAKGHSLPGQTLGDNWPGWALPNLQINVPSDGRAFDMFSYHEMRPQLVHVFSLRYLATLILLITRAIVEAIYRFYILLELSDLDEQFQLECRNTKRSSKKRIVTVLLHDIKDPKKKVKYHYYVPPVLHSPCRHNHHQFMSSIIWQYRWSVALQPFFITLLLLIALCSLRPTPRQK